MVARKKIDEEAVQLSADEIAFHPHSFADDAGRLFWWNDKLWRGIRPGRARFFDNLFSDGTIGQLIGLGLLIDSERTNIAVDGYEMVVSHRKLPFVSYPNEWCAQMLKGAALSILDLSIALAQRGLSLRDSHPWNVLFDWSRPVYIDLTSIVPDEGEPTWRAYDEFCRFCYYPLILMAHGQERIARSLLPEYDGILRSELLSVMRGSPFSPFVASRIFKRGVNSLKSVMRGSRPSIVNFLQQARSSIEALHLPSYEKEHRRRRFDTISSASFETKGETLPLAVRKLLERLRPDTLLDLSPGPIWTSIVPAIMGFSVVSADSNPARMTALYETARAKDLSILPLIIDFTKPTAAMGYSNHYSIAATERLKCDMVLALGLPRKLHFENYFNFDLIAEGLSSFSKKRLIVDCDSGEENGASGSRVGSFRLQNFMDSLSKHFNAVNVVFSNSNYGVLLCEK